MRDELTVGAIARLAGVTVRTLHHYDEIGLVVPAGRTDSGYRTYGSNEAERLQEVLFFRELGFSLETIRDIVGSSGYNREAALEQQRELLEERSARLLVMIEAIDQAVLSQRNGVRMSSEDMLEVFGDFDPKEYEEEAKERWGGTEAYDQSVQRTSSYSKAEWETIGEENQKINEAFLALMDIGTPATDPAAMEVAERHRSHISKWYYECTIEIHADLGQMYTADERFRKNIDKAGEGLAEYMSAAIAANARK